jgi:hypothetical protein
MSRSQSRFTSFKRRGARRMPLASASSLLFGLGLLASSAPASAATTHGANVVAPSALTLSLGNFHIVLLPPDPCLPSAIASRRCIDVIPGVVQFDIVSPPVTTAS